MEVKSGPPKRIKPKLSVGIKLFLLILMIAIGWFCWSWYDTVNKEVNLQLEWFNDDTRDNIINSSIDIQKVKEVFEIQLLAMKDCDIELANSIITEKSKEIIHFTCSNMANERKCYIDKQIEVHTKEKTAILFFPPYNYDSGWPFFFALEDGEWKIDYYKMSNGITMLGAGCNTGWGWRSLETIDEFCSFFDEGECPDKS